MHPAGFPAPVLFGLVFADFAVHMIGMQRIYQFRRFPAPEMTWLGKLGLFATVVLGIALVGAFALVSLVIAAVLVPVVAIALLVFRWKIGRLQKQAAAARDGAETRRPAVIETDYVVLDRQPGS